MKYVYDATSIVYLVIVVVLLAALVKVFFLDPRKKPNGD